MLYLALGFAALVAVLWLGRGGAFKRREWRILSSGAAVAVFTAAAFSGVRGAWPWTLALLVLGLWLAVSSRRSEQRPGPGRAPKETLSEADARAILGVGPEAGSEEIQAAYSRLMRMAHPDKGGTSGLAAQLNAARDRLLRR